MDKQEWLKKIRDVVELLSVHAPMSTVAEALYPLIETAKQEEREKTDKELAEMCDEDLCNLCADIVREAIRERSKK